MDWPVRIASSPMTLAASSKNAMLAASAAMRPVELSCSPDLRKSQMVSSRPVGLLQAARMATSPGLVNRPMTKETMSPAGPEMPVCRSAWVVSR